MADVVPQGALVLYHISKDKGFESFSSFSKTYQCNLSMQFQEPFEDSSIMFMGAMF